MDGILLKVSELLITSDGSGQRKDVEIGKQWTCDKSHVLGVVVRVKMRGHVGDKPLFYYVDRLLFFRNAVDPSAESPAEVEVAAEIEGTTYDLRCNVPGCGCVRTWWMGESAMERLVDRLKK